MNFRTIINIPPSGVKIGYDDKVMFIGSCFASYIGDLMKMGKMDVMVNPSGTVYNPVSVCNTIDDLVAGKITTEDDLFKHEGTWLSFSHYTGFCSDDPDRLLRKINESALQAREFLGSARFLFITFGTARIYRLKETGAIVSNCHKVPSSHFDNELLSVNEIIARWDSFLDRLAVFNPDLKIVFTISPVRHWKDGAHGNQVSKSVLFVAMEELLKHQSGPHYFPAYELLMDDLRDYRFYNDDMLHPSVSAIDYIWEKFSGAYLDAGTVNLRNEIMKISRAFNHRFINDSPYNKRVFAEKMLKQIKEIQLINPRIDFSSEAEYFRTLAGSEINSPD